MNAATPPPYNPYAAPAASPMQSALATASPVEAPRGTALTWVCGAAVPALALSEGLTNVGKVMGVDASVTGLAAIFTLVVLLVVLVCSMTWLALAWSGIPGPLRGTLTPWGAVGRNFIPLYGMYWMFKMVDLLCSAIDALLFQAGSTVRAPKELGRIAAACTLGSSFLSRSVPTWGWLVAVAGHAFWFAYMLKCDAGRRAMAGVVVQGSPAAR
jgi:hypothetical protein